MDATAVDGGDNIALSLLAAIVATHRLLLAHVEAARLSHVGSNAQFDGRVADGALRLRALASSVVQRSDGRCAFGANPRRRKFGERTK